MFHATATFINGTFFIETVSDMDEIDAFAAKHDGAVIELIKA